MKKSIISPLCSALIIPGLGQIMNNNLKKGMIILGIVFLLFVGGVVKLAFIITESYNNPNVRNIEQEIFNVNGFPALWIIIIAFGITWFYSVLDAFREGRIIDKNKDKKNH